MDWRSSCSCVIPCLNEAGAIGPLVQKVRQIVPTVLVVDDGSQDGTGNVARNAGAIVLANAVCQGKGSALRTGCAEAFARGFGWTLLMDGDGQHAPEDIPAFFECAERSSADMIVGNRMGQSARMPWLRRQVNKFMSWQISRMSGLSLPDSQCGFRLLRLDPWSRLRFATTGFEIESEMLLEFVRAGLRVEFVPIRAIYKDERSKIHPCRDTLRWLRWRRQAGRVAEALPQEIHLNRQQNKTHV